MSDCAFEKDIIVNEAFCDAVIDDPELEIVIRNLIITAIEMYTAQFYEEPDNPEKFHENIKDFTKKILVRYFDMLDESKIRNANWHFRIRDSMENFKNFAVGYHADIGSVEKTSCNSVRDRVKSSSCFPFRPPTPEHGSTETVSSAFCAILAISIGSNDLFA